MGSGANLEEILEEVSVSGLIISCRDMADKNHKRLIDLCRSKGISLRRFVVNLEDVDLEQGPS
jgi:hypothetical protein